MALGDITWFDEAMEYERDGGFATTDDIKVAVIDNTTTPIAGFTAPLLTSFTEVGAAGSYIAGGQSIGTWGAFNSEAAAILTMDSATNPSWAQNVLNDTDAYWLIVYNDTDATKRALAFVDLVGPKDMSIGPLTATWNALGLARVTKAP